MIHNGVMTAATRPKKPKPLGRIKIQLDPLELRRVKLLANHSMLSVSAWVRALILREVEKSPSPERLPKPSRARAPKE